ncbi:hypothetical protein EMCG_07757 [[Emmonsia] crescens]|uniref:Uncharacterized protein n=1 Tax=[Emmonsia] crescens TaxID=73230 RepID=A0A0G2I7P3_9EURO|nr:hypothetical protein EMCG_07757 [Emmonsia crescens UAMH 3008]
MYTTDVSSRRGCLVLRVPPGESRSLTSSLNPRSYGVDRSYSFSRLDGRNRSPPNDQTILSIVALDKNGGYPLSTIHRNRTAHHSPSTYGLGEIRVVEISPRFGADVSGLRNSTSLRTTTFAPHTNATPLTIKTPTRRTQTSYSSFRYPALTEMSDLSFSTRDRACLGTNVSRTATYSPPCDTRRRPRLPPISTSRSAIVELSVSPNGWQYKYISPRTPRFSMEKSRAGLPLSPLRTSRPNQPWRSPSKSGAKLYCMENNGIAPICPSGIYGTSLTSTTAPYGATARQNFRHDCSRFNQTPSPPVIIPAKKLAHLPDDIYDVSRDFMKSGRNCRRSSTVESAYSPYRKRRASQSPRPTHSTTYPITKLASKKGRHAFSDVDCEDHPNIIWTNAKMKLREREV